MFFLKLTFLLVLTGKVYSHVALSFPPARKYNLDFLDTIRTEGPCGMNKGSVKTPLPAGKQITVTWHLGYAHKGGYLIELLDSKGSLLHDLTGGFKGEEQKNLQEQIVEIPDGLDCPDCTIRLTRQAAEWGSSYNFVSCADVEIVPQDKFSPSCNNVGSPLGSGGCSCESTYSGEYCQYKNDCETDRECGNNGKCIDNAGTNFPKKECYCNFGYHGQRCEHHSSFISREYDPELFKQVKLKGNDLTLLWRYVDINEEEVEMVIIARTTSYVAIGWRPQDLKKSCQAFPKDALAPKGVDFVAMDCQDMIIGKVKGDKSNIGDYYTRDRSTPRRDEFWGGKSDITAAIGWEEDGTTTIMFRKLVQPSQGDFSDHEFYGPLKIVWAHGRSDDPFYTQDELKYHGGNRGSYELTQTSKASALGLSDQRQILVAGIIIILFVMSIQAVQNIAETCIKTRKEKSEDKTELQTID